MAPRETKKAFRMRPSLETAVAWFDGAGWVLVAALAIGVVCTIIIVFMGIVKEGYWDEARETARVRIAELATEGEKAKAEVERAHADIEAARQLTATLENSTALARAEAAAANERAANSESNAAFAQMSASGAMARAAEAERRAAQARLELAKYKAPRSISPEQQKVMAESLKAFPGTPFDFSVLGAESVTIMQQIADALELAGWSRKPWSGGGILRNIPGKPPAGDVILFGIVLQMTDPALSEALKALVGELKAAELEEVYIHDPENSTPPRIHIMIGQKR